MKYLQAEFSHNGYGKAEFNVVPDGKYRVVIASVPQHQAGSNNTLFEINIPCKYKSQETFRSNVHDAMDGYLHSKEVHDSVR